MRNLRIKIPDPLYDRLMAASISEERSLQFIMKRAIEKIYPIKKRRNSSSIPIITSDQVTIFNLKPEHRVSYEIQEAWLKLFEDKVWIQKEIDKANNWLILNKHKARKSNFGMYFNTWLNKSWDKYRVTLKPNEDHKSTYHIEQMKRLERGEL